ncbi:MAG: pseudouridine synthase [Betaproteobacteria bacterium]|nr:pseudouridine synthase [Betaproteobacteria bacterium]
MAEQRRRSSNKPSSRSGAGTGTGTKPPPRPGTRREDKPVPNRRTASDRNARPVHRDEDRKPGPRGEAEGRGAGARSGSQSRSPGARGGGGDRATGPRGTGEGRGGPGARAGGEGRSSGTGGRAGSAERGGPGVRGAGEGRSGPAPRAGSQGRGGPGARSGSEGRGGPSARAGNEGRSGPGARGTGEGRGSATRGPAVPGRKPAVRNGGEGRKPGLHGGPDTRDRAPIPEVPVVPVSRRSPSVSRHVPPPPPPASTDGQSQKLQKVLAQAGLGSRREMEELISTGKVLVNGLPATLGMRVNPDDLVKVGRRQLRFKLSPRLPRVIIYHKPEGEIVSRDDPDKRASVFDRLPVIRSGKWLAIGRLDFNTCGLLIFTTSGELANRMTHPRFEVEREYAVRIMGELTQEQGKELLSGVELTDGTARFDVLEDQGGQGRNHWYRVVVREGRNRLVRRMFEHFGFTVSRLMRVRFGIVNLPPRLKRGQHLELTEAQTRSVLEWLASARKLAGEDADEADDAPLPAPPPPSRVRAPRRPAGRRR